MNLSNFVIILCRASEPGNVGAACRAMKNMGLSRLRMVAPLQPWDEAPLVARAVHADDVWRSACFFDTLAEAAADCSLVVGTTRRRGRKRKNATMEPRALAEWLAAREPFPAKPPDCARVAIVFGNERTGLEDDELGFCNVASHIPACDAFPSLNLSHAVQIYAYELFLAFGGYAADGYAAGEYARANLVKGEWVPLERPAVDGLTAEISAALGELGFYKTPGDRSRFVRDLISRAGLTEREGRYLRDIFVKAVHLAQK